MLAPCAIKGLWRREHVRLGEKDKRGRGQRNPVLGATPSIISQVADIHP